MALWWMLSVTQLFGISEALPPKGGAIPVAMMTEPSPPSTAFYNAMVDKRASRGGVTTAHLSTVQRNPLLWHKMQLPSFETGPSSRIEFKPIPFANANPFSDTTRQSSSPPPPLKLVRSADDRNDLLRRRAGLPGNRSDRLRKAKWQSPAPFRVNFGKNQQSFASPNLFILRYP